MSTEYIGRQEHEEYVKRMEQEHKGINARIKDLENNVEKIVDLTLAVNNMANSIEAMVKEQKKQGERIESIEGRDGERWRTVTGYIITAVIGILIGFVFKQIGF
mgnify:FL=1|jgi:tetrahydromethanopterin S-methyltransferase subunit B